MPLDERALSSTYGAGATRPSAPPTGYQQALDYYSGPAGYGVQSAYLDKQKADEQLRLGLLQARQGLAGSQAGQNSNFANQDYALAMSKLGVQRDALGINGGYYNNLLGLQGTLTNLANQLYGFNTQDINNQAGTATRNQTSQAVANGALQSKNTIAGLADIITQRDIGLGKAKNAYEGTLENLTERQLGLQHSLDLNANQNRMLDEMAKEYGLNRDKALAGINQGLASMNLDNVIGIKDIMDALESNDNQRMQLANQIARDAMSAYGGGYFGYPGVYSGTTAGTSTHLPHASASPKKSSKLPNTNLSTLSLTGG